MSEECDLWKKSRTEKLTVIAEKLRTCSSYHLAHGMYIVFFFNDTAPTEIYTLSLHDALPISSARPRQDGRARTGAPASHGGARPDDPRADCARARHRRSEEHTSELQSRFDLVCRLLLEKKKKKREQKQEKKRQQSRE